MREINLSKGYLAQVDDEDFERVNQFKWCANEDKRPDGTIRNVYAMRKVGNNKTQKMHRFILGVTDPNVQVDHHPDFSGLNNLRSNLRSATHAQNQHNARLRSVNTSGYKGVSWHKAGQKWQAKIQIEGKHKHLGYFTDAEQAALAYDLAAAKYFGQFACTNATLQDSVST